MKIVVTGASGFIGGAVARTLRAEGHTVIALVRRQVSNSGEVRWDPAHGWLDPVVLDGVEAVINLAGENIAAGRWTPRRRDALLRSRIDSTRTLVNAIQASARRPAVLVNASAVGIYGDCGDRVLRESDRPGSGFLAGVTARWEVEANRAAELGVRVVCLRLGVVLGPGGGALAKMLPVFRLGLGGRVGSGRQWMSWVHRDDVVGVIGAALSDKGFTGPFNVVAPEPVTNREFACALAGQLGRRAWLPVPGLLLRALFGAMADETLLASQRAEPMRLRELGFRFRHERVQDALRSALVSR